MFNDVVDRVIKDYQDKKLNKIVAEAPKVKVVRLEPMKPTRQVGGFFGYK
jgi:hypothetical protein